MTFVLKTKKIYIIRHGQTDYNKQSKVQGRGINASLNDLGRRQAQSFYEQYGHVKFDKVYTSSLVRTIESVEAFLTKGFGHKSLEGLDEISWGDHEGRSFNKEMHEHYLEIISEWQSGNFTPTVGGGESPLDVMARQRVAMDHIMAQTDEQLILIATHGRAMRILLCWLLNYPLSKMDMFEHHNLCLYILNHSGTTFSVEKFNDTSHLNGLGS